MTRLIRALAVATILAALMAAPALAGQHLCANYPSQAAAQNALASQPQLDGNDNDGIACESNPAPYSPQYQAAQGRPGGAGTGTTGGAGTGGTTPGKMPTTGAGGMAEESPAGPIAAVAGATLLAGAGLVALRRRRVTT